MSVLTTPSLSEYPDLGEKTYRVIKELVMAGSLPPGRELVVVELADQLGVSRTPVKDALNRLFAEGLVVHEPRKGYLVSVLNPAEVSELMDARVLIELAAIERGIRLIEQADVDEMRRIVSAMEQCIDDAGQHYTDYSEYLRRDGELHRLIVSTARNRRLSDLYETLNVHSYMVRMHNAVRLGDRRVQRSIQEHRDILTAFESRDLEMLRRTIQHNIYSFVEVFQGLSTPEQQP